MPKRVYNRKQRKGSASFSSKKRIQADKSLTPKAKKIMLDTVKVAEAGTGKSWPQYPQTMSAGAMLNVDKSAAYNEAQKQHEFSQLVRENENLKRVLATQKEVIDTLCRAMIETNAVEGRWR